MRISDWSSNVCSSGLGRLHGMQRALLIAAAVLLLDQLSKWAVLSLIMPPPCGIALTGFFNLVLTYNTGVSFGLFQGEAAWQPYFLIAVNLAVAAALLLRSDAHTSELHTLMRSSYAVF